MYPRLSSDRFAWTISQDERGLTIVLTDAQTSKTKVFFQAGSVAPEAMNEHMNTLTDELCEAFWPRPREKKAKKQQKEE